MNRVRKTIKITMIISALLLMMSIPSRTLRAADSNMDKDLVQVSASGGTVTVKWNTMQGIDREDPTIKREMDHYTLQLYGEINSRGEGIKSYDKPYTMTFPENGSKTYTATLKNLPKNYWGKVRVNLTYKLYKKNGDTYDYVETVTDKSELHCNVYTAPSRPATSEFGVSDDIKSNSLLIKSWIKVKAPKWYLSSEVELYQGNKRIQKEDLLFLSEKKFKLKKGCAYQYRVRYYSHNFLNGDTYYSPWSQWKGFVIPQNIAFNSSPSKKGFKLTLGKLPGVSKYTVYTSVKKKTGFKKAKTFKAKSKKKYSVQITKKYKKGKKNYIKIVPYVKLKYFKGPSEFAIITPRPLKIYK